MCSSKTFYDLAGKNFSKKILKQSVLRNQKLKRNVCDTWRGWVGDERERERERERCERDTERERETDTEK